MTGLQPLDSQTSAWPLLAIGHEKARLLRPIARAWQGHSGQEGTGLSRGERLIYRGTVGPPIWL